MEDVVQNSRSMANLVSVILKQMQMRRDPVALQSVGVVIQTLTANAMVVRITKKVILLMIKILCLVGSNMVCARENCRQSCFCCRLGTQMNYEKKSDYMNNVEIDIFCPKKTSFSKF